MKREAEQTLKRSQFRREKRRGKRRRKWDKRMKRDVSAVSRGN
jgi:hypothetical protein